MVDQMFLQMTYSMMTIVGNNDIIPYTTT